MQNILTVDISTLMLNLDFKYVFISNMTENQQLSTKHVCSNVWVEIFHIILNGTFLWDINS